MKKLRGALTYISKHKYGIVFLAFAVTIGFLDENSFWHRHKQQQELRTLHAEIQKYSDMFAADTKKLEEQESNPHAIVRIARERYFMKMADEDIYVIEKDEETE